MRLRPKRLETLPLRLPPALVARRLRVLAGNIDVDAGDFERSRAVDRGNPAVASFHLRVDDSGQDKAERAQGVQEGTRGGEPLADAFGDNGVEIQAACG